MTRYLVTAAALGVALVSPALAGTKPTISSIHLAAAAVGQPIIARSHPFTFACSTAAIAVSTVGRCGPVPAATFNGGISPNAFTKPERLNETYTFRCASSVAVPNVTDPRCAAEATVTRSFSADALTKEILRVNPPILVRCAPLPVVRRPTPPWCTSNGSGRSEAPVPATRPVSTVGAHHFDPPHSLGFTLQLGNASPQLFWTIDP